MVRQQTNSASIKSASVSLKGEKGKFDFSLFRLLAKVNSKSNPRIPVEIMHKVEL